MFLHLLLLLVLYLLEHLLVFQLLVPLSFRLKGKIVATRRSSLSPSSHINRLILVLLLLLLVLPSSAATDNLFLHLRDEVLNMLLSLGLVF